MHMKIIQLPKFSDLISSGIDILYLLRPSRFALSKTLACRNKPYTCGLATSGADRLQEF